MISIIAEFLPSSIAVSRDLSGENFIFEIYPNFVQVKSSCDASISNFPTLSVIYEAIPFL